MEGTRSSSCRSLDADGDVEIEAEAPGRVHTFDGWTNKYGAPAMGEPSIDIYFSFLPCVWRLAFGVAGAILSLSFAVFRGLCSQWWRNHVDSLVGRDDCSTMKRLKNGL